MQNSPSFIPGLELCGRFYEELVRPLLETHFADLRYSAALIGYGSEVLGFDTPMSMDHAWSPRLYLFIEESQAHLSAEIHAMLAEKLPRQFLGFSLDTRFSDNEPGVFHMVETSGSGPIQHQVRILTLREFVLAELEWDLLQPLEEADWLSFPAQKLRTLTAGQVYFDNSGEISALRSRLSYYPRDVWLYLLASGWARIAEEQHLMPRAGFVGDELGSALIGARLVQDVMSLWFLMNRVYAPYPKWFGSAFEILPGAGEIQPCLNNALHAQTWKERELALGQAYLVLINLQNTLKLAALFPPVLTSFHNRPFQVCDADGIAAALAGSMTSPDLVRLAGRGLIGGLDQFSDNTILRSEPGWRMAVRALYSPAG